MVPPNMIETTKTNPVKKIEEKNIMDALEEEVEQPYEEEDLEEVAPNEPVIPTNKPQPPVNNAQIEWQLEMKIRRLCEVETQLITKKIALKNPDSLTGVYSEQEMISLAQSLKVEVQALIDIMKQNGYEDKFFLEKFKEVEKGIKAYEYWVVPDKKK